MKKNNEIVNEKLTEDIHSSILKYPELYDAVQKFDASYEKKLSKQKIVGEYGNVAYPSDVDEILNVIADFIHVDLSSEEVAIHSFLLELIHAEYPVGGYGFYDPLFDGIKKLIQGSVEDEDIVHACVHIINYVREHTME